MGNGIGIVVLPAKGKKIMYSFMLDFTVSNNEAEYEATLVGLQVVRDIGDSHVQDRTNS